MEAVAYRDLNKEIELFSPKFFGPPHIEDLSVENPMIGLMAPHLDQMNLTRSYSCDAVIMEPLVLKNLEKLAEIGVKSILKDLTSATFYHLYVQTEIKLLYNETCIYWLSLRSSSLVTFNKIIQSGSDFAMASWIASSLAIPAIREICEVQMTLSGLSSELSELTPEKHFIHMQMSNSASRNLEKENAANGMKKTSP